MSSQIFRDLNKGLEEVSSSIDYQSWQRNVIIALFRLGGYDLQELDHGVLDS